jgi:hypothetical protein
MANHPNRSRALKTEVEGMRFKLSLDATGNPHTLKQWQQDRAGQWHWAIVWVAWREDKPTGARAIALRQIAILWGHKAATADVGTTAAETTGGRARR